MSHFKESEAAAPARRRRLRHWLQIAAVAAVAASALVLRLLEVSGAPHPELPSGAESAIFGLSILAAATLLIWASEVAEQLISATLALAVLAIIAVLPEYAVDLFFAWTAADNPENAQFALANMTGANRLLIGFAWPLVFLNSDAAGYISGENLYTDGGGAGGMMTGALTIDVSQLGS